MLSARTAESDKIEALDADADCYRVKPLSVGELLTPVEYTLAAALISRESQVLTHRQWLREVWGLGSVEHRHYPRISLGDLRGKLEIDPARPAHSLTKTGAGSRFGAQPALPAATPQ